MKSIFKILIIAMVLISLLFFVMNTDLGQVMSQLSELRHGFIYIIVISLLGFLTGAYGWKQCLPNSNISLLHLAYIRTTGELISLFNPTNIIAGEAYKQMSLKPYVKNPSELLDSILISRVIMIGTQVLLSMICVGYILSSSGRMDIILLCAKVILVSIIVFGIGFKAWQLWGIRISIHIPQHWKLRQYIDQAKQVLLRVIDQMRSNPSMVAKASFWTVLHWFMGGLEIMTILYLLGFSISFFSGLSVDMGVVVLKSLAGFVPGQFGIEELSNKLMLDFIGISIAGIWISVSIIRRGKQLFWICLSAAMLGVVHLLTKRKKIADGHTVLNS